MMNKLFRVKFKNSLTNKGYVVYNVRNDKIGYQQFLICDNGMWIYRSAKIFVPVEDDE